MAGDVADIVRDLKARRLPPGDESTGSAPSLDVSHLVERFRRAFDPRTARDIFEEWFPWTRDQRLATDPSLPDGERMAVLGRRVADTR